MSDTTSSVAGFIAKVLAAISVFLVGCLVGAFITEYAINWLFTTEVLRFLFGTASLNLLQAFVLNVICGMLFKSYSSN
jgi:predicted Na+-dependent transporter